MKRVLVIILLIISNLTYLKCADNYEMGDILYVWAKSGLNVRVGPGTDNHVIAKIPFGESILVWGKTDKIYNVMGIDTIGSYRFPNLKVEPIIFKGNWVQIQMLDGQVGYVIDQYLLRYKPRIKDISANMNVELLSADTLYKRPPSRDGIRGIYRIQRKYAYEMTELAVIGHSWRNVEYSILNATIEEVLVFLSASLNDFSKVQLIQIGEEEVVFSMGICIYSIKQMKEGIAVKYECSRHNNR